MKNFLLSKVEYIVIGMLFIIFMMWSISKIGKKEEKSIPTMGYIYAYNYTLVDLDLIYHRSSLCVSNAMGDITEGIFDTKEEAIEEMKKDTAWNYKATFHEIDANSMSIYKIEKVW